MKYYLIAGERSGDLHASKLMQAIKAKDRAAEFRFWGGDEMQKVSPNIVQHYKDLAFMGLWEVIVNLRTILKFVRICQKDILSYQPDAVILVDYAGFNLRIAKFIKKAKPEIPIYYYISPKVWAWNTRRALRIKKNIDKMFVIFPFEVAFYKQFDYEVHYVGNPLMDALTEAKANPEFRQENKLSEKPIVALLPGSRKQEVRKMLELMLSLRTEFLNYQFVIAGVNNLPRNFYEKYEETANVSVIYDKTYELLQEAESAIVTSGTATLETALLSVPQVVVYKTSPLTYLVAKQVLKVKFLSLVNLILDKALVVELIQKELNTENLKQELTKILKGGERREEVLKGYKILRDKVGEAGASERTGKLIVDYLVQQKKTILRK